MINPHKYSARNIARMKKGKAPKMEILVYIDDEMGNEIREVTMELHHRALPQRLKTSKVNELWNLTPTTPWGHASMDPYRYIEYELKKVLKGVNSW